MKLDLRYPTFVFLGSWNRAIFQPGWILRHLFEVPEGETVRGAQILPVDPPQVPILYILDIGFSITNERFAIYVNRFNEKTSKRAEKIAVRLFRILPHTPFGAYGVNYRFFEDSPDAELYDKLKTRDGIDQAFKVLRQNLVATFEVEKGVLLNLARQPTSENVSFEFNYHFNSISADTAEALLAGSIKKYCDMSKDVLRKLYGITGDDTVSSEIPELQEAKDEGQTK